MSESPAAVDASEKPAALSAPLGRVVSIDILRGLAILWVMVFHVWGDQTHAFAGSEPLYQHFRDRIAEGRLWPACTALVELIVGSGYQGVTIFMLLSGLSLTMNAYTRGEPPLVRAYRSRFRKLLIPYWAGIGIIVATIAAIALVQVALDGGTFAQQWDRVTLYQNAPVMLRLRGVLQSLTVVGNFRELRGYMPSGGALWFVPLLLQYYLVFPFALLLLRRVGPQRFFAIGLLVVIVAREIAARLAAAHFNMLLLSQWENDFSWLRGSEFVIGMTIGYLLVHNYREVAAWTSSAVDIAGIVVLAILLQLAGTVMAGRSHFLGTMSFPVLHAGLALYLLPLVFKPPGFLERTWAARGLVFLGVVAFPALIVNESMRFVSSFLQYEGVPDALWWIFVVAVYIPVGTLLAYPLASVLGLLPKRRAARSAPHGGPVRATGEPAVVEA